MMSPAIERVLDSQIEILKLRLFPRLLVEIDKYPFGQLEIIQTEGCSRLSFSRFLFSAFKIIFPIGVLHDGDGRFDKLATGDFELLLQQGHQLRPQLEVFEGNDFASLVGDVDILSRYAKGKEREPHLPIDPDLQAGRPGGSGLDAGPVGIYVEGEGENDYCQNKGCGNAAKDKKDFFLLRIH